jgi:hypothetical protein
MIRTNIGSYTESNRVHPKNQQLPLAARPIVRIRRLRTIARPPLPRSATACASVSKRSLLYCSPGRARGRRSIYWKNRTDIAAEIDFGGKRQTLMPAFSALHLAAVVRTRQSTA